MQILRDLLCVGLAFLAAYFGRFAFPSWWPYGQVSEAQETIVVGAVAVLLWPLLAVLGGLYGSRRAQSLASEVFDVARVTGVAFLLLVTVTYFWRDVRYSRGTLLLWVGLTFFLVSMVRIGSRAALGAARARGYNLRHVLVVGQGPLLERVVEAVTTHNVLGLRLLARLPVDAASAGSVLTEALEQYKGRVDQVIVALPIESLGALRDMMPILSRETVDVRLVPDFYQFMTLCGSVEEFSGLPVINLQATPLWGWNLVAKRVFDVVFGVGILVVTAPLLGVLWLAVRLTSPGPVIFTQERVGMDGHTFAMFKFRTMRVDAEELGPRMTSRADDRRTPIGIWLRRFSLDELPQLWNVIRGDMSLVGPRPEQPKFIEEFKRGVPRYALRHKIKAGMTGWAQVNGLRGDTSIEKRIEMDLYYIENWSLSLDMKILWRTVMGGFLSPNAF